MKKRNVSLLIVLFLALLLVVLFGPGVCTLYKLQTHPPQIETIYQATADRDPPERSVYEIPDTFRRDYLHYLFIGITSRTIKSKRSGGLEYRISKKFPALYCGTPFSNREIIIL